ncbi:hypothetical protein P4O66_003270 [Electrophorus voltai]|uniref:Cadherin-13 n=1 Tax=Electrophorus voltai TaxID=2609070 RepID=A0AAD8YRJ2_9TELE|nr:hypothetical protein P4O66_003270 [Electrophorus voltai]
MERKRVKDRVVFDDCAGSKGVAFEVSNPDFLIDKDWNLIPRRDVTDSDTVIFVHGLSPHADDTAQVDIIGAPPTPTRTLRDLLVLEGNMAYRTKRSLLVPPMFVPENQRAPFPRSIGKAFRQEVVLNWDGGTGGRGLGAQEKACRQQISQNVPPSFPLPPDPSIMLSLSFPSLHLFPITHCHLTETPTARFRLDTLSGFLLPGSRAGRHRGVCVQVISSDMKEDHIFRLSGKGADQDPKGVFSINRLTGEVAVSRALDREALAFYHLQVSTTDMSGKLVEGPVDLDVHVIDQNDNRPIFREPHYSGEVLEGSPTVHTDKRMCSAVSTAVHGPLWRADPRSLVPLAHERLENAGVWSEITFPMCSLIFLQTSSGGRREERCPGSKDVQVFLYFSKDLKKRKKKKETSKMFT